LTLWERGEGILMAANLIGSVVIGFGAVLLGTVLARWLEAPATEASAAGSQRVEAMAAEHSHPARTEEGQTISAKVDAVGGVDGQLGANGGNQ
jgi:hypothetical protein